MSAQETGWAGQLPEIDAGLSPEWLDSLDDVVDLHGPNTARLILDRLMAVLAALADTDDAKPEGVADAIVHYGIDPDAVEPRQA
jgi:pyruvate dehydrogenase complex dehydrogenase (E1) component